VTARLASLSPRAQGGVIAGVLLVVALLGYFVLISPKRSTAADLKKQTTAVQKQIDQNRSTAFTKALPAVRAASIFKLTQAMPSQLDTPDVILQLNQLADNSGLSFDQIQPGSTDASGSTVTTVSILSVLAGGNCAWALQEAITRPVFRSATGLVRAE